MFRRKFIAAILASEVVSNIDIFPAEANGAIAPGAHIGLQAHDTGDLVAVSDRAGKDAVELHDLDLALEPKDNGFLPAHDFHGLIAGVK